MNRIPRVGLLVFAMALVASLPGTAQSSWDLFDPIYDDLEAWELAGIIPPLPWLRPYAPQFIRGTLEFVAASGGPEGALAESYLAELPDPVDVSPKLEQTVRVDGAGAFYSETSPTAQFAFAVPGVSADGAYSPNLLDYEDGLVLPPLVRDRRDWIPDWSDIELFGKSLYIRQSLDSNTAVGGGRWWFQAGFGRSTYGPFFGDGAVLSRHAPRAGRFSLTFQTRPLTFQLLMLELTATDDSGAGRYPDKRLVFHSFQWRVAPWLQVGFYESVVYGNRFDPRYFVPLSVLYLTQGLGGFVDNSLLGLTFDFRPVPWLRLPVTVYADDVHFNDIVRFDFETKYKLSAQAGVAMHPPWIEEIDVVSLDYLAVMPYMYSHRDQDTTVPNYSNYTHFGSNLGPSVHPNSDRISFLVRGRPVSPLRASLSLAYVRHGNPSEGITDGDGTIFDDGYDGGNPTFQSETRFLTQEVLERTFSVGATVDAAVRAGPLTFSGALSYTFSRTTNADLVVGAAENGHHVSISAAVTY